jgi:1,4-alpha-glucan branching enzyme
VDGNWITDPENKLMVGGNENRNSFFTVKPNYTFTFKADSTVKSVKLSGTFNNWEKEGYTMQKTPNGEWIFPLYLKPGKYLYKLIVDGNWIVDPGNSLWEENEFNNGNSVLWIENKPAQ